MKTRVWLAVSIVVITTIAAMDASAKGPGPGPGPGGGLPALDVVTTPNGTGANELLGVSAISASDVWAVGYRGTQTLTERWNGSAFSIVPSPSVAGRASVLEDVDGTASNTVWAVGHADRTDFVGSQTLTLRWNGSAWTQVPSPNRGGAEDTNELNGVAVISPTDVWAVGAYANINPASARALTFHWNGTAWTDVPNPCGSVLRDVVALSSTNVWAVGGNSSCQWNGSSWTRRAIAPSPNPQVSIDLQDVTAVAPNNLWAVGIVASSCGEGQVCHSGVVERWNGSSWSFTGVAVILYGVKAISSTVYAVGIGRGPTVIRLTLPTWETVPAPTPQLVGTLYAIDAVGNDLWAAGSSFDGTYRTLVERAPSPVSGAVVGATGVSQATVSWFGPESGSVETDVEGRYQVGGLNVGQYTFVATNPGCTPAQRTVNVPAGVTTTVDLLIGC